MDSQKRFLIAIIAAIAVLFIYQKVYVVPRLQQAQVQQNEQTPYVRSEITPVAIQKEQTPATTSREQTLSSIYNENFEVMLTDDGARIMQIMLAHYKNTQNNEQLNLLNPDITEKMLSGPFLLEDLFLEKAVLSNWDIVNSTATSIAYTTSQKTGAHITKEIKLHNSSYGIELRLKIKNNNNMPLPIKYKLIGPSSLFVKPGMDERFYGVDVKIGEDAQRLNPRTYIKKGSKIFYDSPKWISTRGRYFTLALEAGQPEQAAFIEQETDKSVRAGVLIGPITLGPQEEIERVFVMYAGPNDREQIAKVSASMVDVATFGKLSAICNVLLKILRFFNGIVHNYGIAIILLVLLVSLAIFPLTKKSLTSMKEMQLVQPEIEKIKKEHKSNPQKQQKEIMELYKKHKINPLGGCLPMVFQMPIFISLYQVLIRSVELKGAKFLWIKDLTEPDAAFKLSEALPLLKIEHINILPILMIFGMFIQQKVAQPKGTQSEQQKMMAIMMPVIFGFIFYNMPSGFVLYWLTYTTITIILQEFVLKTRHAKPKTA